ncbi:hypothetical protein H0H93_001902, partial [Arthromyces matolae]
IRPLSTVSRASAHQQPQYRILSMMGFVHILRIAIAIALIALLAPTTRAVDNAGSSGIPGHIQNHLDRQHDMIPPSQPEAHRLSQLLRSASAKLHPNEETRLANLEAKYNKQYGLKTSDDLLQQFREQIRAHGIPSKPEAVEQAWKKDLVERSVELIVLGRLMIIKREKGRTLNGDGFQHFVWKLICFLEIVTPSNSVTDKGQEKAKGREVFVDYWKQNLSAFEQTMNVMWQQHCQQTRDLGNWRNLDLDEMGEQIQRRIQPLSDKFSQPQNQWASWDTNSVHELLFLVRLWVSVARAEGLHWYLLQEKAQKAVDIIDKMLSSTPVDRGRSVRKYLLEERAWFQKQADVPPAYGQHAIRVSPQSLNWYQLDFRLLSTVSRASSQQEPQDQTLGMMGIVHILRIAIAITLIALLGAPTTRAVHDAGSSIPGHLRSHLDRHHEMIPSPKLPTRSLSQLLRSAAANLNPTANTRLTDLEEGYNKKYKLMKQDDLQDQFSQRLESSGVPSNLKDVEQAWKKDLVENSVELIVLGRLLVIKREESHTLDEYAFQFLVWKLIYFLEIVTPTDGVPDKGQEKGKGRGVFVDYWNRNLSAFEETMYFVFQQHARDYGDKQNTESLQDVMDKRIRDYRTSFSQPDASSRRLWTPRETQSLHEFLFLVRLWVGASRGPGPAHGVYWDHLQEKVETVVEIIDKNLSSIPDDRGRSIRKYLKEERDWLRKEVEAPPAYGQHASDPVVNS